MKRQQSLYGEMKEDMKRQMEREAAEREERRKLREISEEKQLMLRQQQQQQLQEEEERMNEINSRRRASRSRSREPSAGLISATSQLTLEGQTLLAGKKHAVTVDMRPCSFWVHWLNRMLVRLTNFNCFGTINAL